MFVACLLALLFDAAFASSAAITPVQKVLEMLEGMKTNGEKLMSAEKATYKTYSEWVDDRTTELGFEIKTAKSKIEELTAFAAKADSDVTQLAGEISELDGDISRLEGEKSDATKLRDDEHAEFVNLEQDYSESVDALQRAIQMLSAQAYDRPQAESLLQRMSKTIPGMQRVLPAFMQQMQKNAGEEDGAPAVAAYKYQGGGVLEVLEGLLDKFKKELDDTVSEEANRAHYYQLTVLHLTNTITKSTSDRNTKASDKASTAAASAKAKGELGSTQATLAEDQKFLADMTALFQQKSATFQANQKVRSDELAAIAKAIEIISSEAVSDSYAGHVKFMQVPRAAGTILAQMKSSKQRIAIQQRAVEFLNKHAEKLSSKALAKLADAAEDSPFAKVIEMIETLLEKLKEEAAAEASHKEWCDAELKANKLKREEKSAAVDKLTAEVEQLTSNIASMASEIDVLLKEQEQLTKDMTEATSLRETEKAENEKTISDAKAGIAAVKQALVILREFYASQEAFIQTSEKQVPELEEYKGMHSEKGGVIGMLEVIESDFQRLEADTTTAEAQAAREYESFMTDATADKKQKHDTEFQTKLAKDQTEFELSQVQKDLTLVEEGLLKSNEYYEHLKPLCLEVHVSYEERVAKRKEEIEALKQAYQILSSSSTD